MILFFELITGQLKFNTNLNSSNSRWLEPFFVSLGSFELAEFYCKYLSPKVSFYWAELHMLSLDDRFPVFSEVETK